MYDDYREIPLKIFIKVLNDETRLQELLPSITTEQWESFKVEFEGENPSPEDEFLIEKQQKVLYPSAKIQLYETLIRFCLVAPESWDKLFEEAGVPRKPTMIESIDNVNKMLAKERVRFNISDAELKKFMSEMPDKDEDSEYNIFDALSSLSAVTGNRLEYNTATIGEFLAEQKLAQRIAEKHNKNGG